MSNMYEVGKVYIWCNIPSGKWSFLNGQETTVMADAEWRWCSDTKDTSWAQLTDTAVRLDGQRYLLAARAGRLRRKDPPPGELLVANLFKITEPEFA